MYVLDVLTVQSIFIQSVPFATINKKLTSRIEFNKIITMSNTLIDLVLISLFLIILKSICIFEFYFFSNFYYISFIETHMI